MAATDRGRASYLREQVLGAIPAAPVWQIARITSASMNYSNQTIESAELDYSMQPADTVKVGAKSAGSFSVEWSPGTMTSFMEAAFRGTFGNAIDVAGEHVIDADTATLTATGAFADAAVGQWVLLSGFIAGESYTGAGDSPNNGWFEIESITSDDAVVLKDPAGRLVDETGPVTARVKGRRMLNGTRKISHAVEIALTDAQSYFAYLGQYVGSLSMTLSAGAIVTGEIAFQGSNADDEQATKEYLGAVSVAATTRTITATGAFADTLPGQGITLSGFTASGNNVTGIVATVPDDDTITLTAATTTLVDENRAIDFTGAVTVTATTRTIAATGAFAGVAVGRSITIAGMTNPGNNVTGIIATKADDNTVTLTAATTTLVNETGPGTATIDSAAVNNAVTIIGAAPTWSLGGSYTAAGTATPWNATNNVGEFYIDGELSTSCFKTLNWTVTNNLRETQCIAQEFPSIDFGTPAMTGSFERLYSDIDLWRKMRDQEPVSIAFGFTGSDGTTGVHFTLPSVKINTNPVDLSGGRNSDVMDKVDWSASKYVNAASEIYYVQVDVA